MTNSIPDTCPECDGSVKRDSDEHYCSACGLVIDEDNIDRGPEWRAFDSAEHEEKARTGSPATNSRHDDGISSEIGWQNKDAYGNNIDSNKIRRMNRMRSWHNRTQAKDSEERHLKDALTELSRMSSALELPRIVTEEANDIYRKALECDVAIGRSKEGVASAVLYSACRIHGFPRSLEEITEVSRVERLRIARSQMKLSKNLDIEIKQAQPEDFIPRYCSELGLDYEVEKSAIEALESYDGHWSGKSPLPIAASAIYAACVYHQLEVTQKEISNTVDVTDVSIRNYYRDLLAEYDDAPDIDETGRIVDDD